MAVRTEPARRLIEHLQSGTTTVCRCWKIIRRDGATMGFTDHDEALGFDGTIFAASSGMAARTLATTTGMAVDNSEALGTLSDMAMSEADILAGRYDHAEVLLWLVNWTDTTERMLQFSGSLGEVTRSGGQFWAELRSLTEALNAPHGRTFQRGCTAIFGDASCGIDADAPEYSKVVQVAGATDGREFCFDTLEEYPARWFEKGRLSVVSGTATGLVGIIKSDRLSGGMRQIDLWHGLRCAVAAGDEVRVEAGCNKRAATCRNRFNNMANFGGFPHVPGEDWLTAYPRSSDENDGGSIFGGAGQFDE
ncbi:DUF2163 domain-containing protein [Tropicimonas sp.]|uniref:DUF2163 domain-containing protein n=1 Tax=Tropicimonas sp. TaxID=2067044 RepID=UPI003A8563DD